MPTPRPPKPRSQVNPYSGGVARAQARVTPAQRRSAAGAMGANAARTYGAANSVTRATPARPRTRKR